MTFDHFRKCVICCFIECLLFHFLYTCTIVSPYHPTQFLYSVIHYQYITMLYDTSTVYQHCYVLVYYNNKNASCLFLRVLLISNWTITFWVWRLYNFQVWMYQAWIVPKLCAYLCPPPPPLVSLGVDEFIYAYVQSSLQHTSESKIKPVIITHWKIRIWMSPQTLRSCDTADVAL